ncbi:MAG: sulfotransferase family 2 domain-containing protein, partial [Anaerolineales bacterium]
MIISHKYRFIFLKTTKTAGTSIEIALSKFSGPTDIITPITPEDEKIREELGYQGPMNYLAPLKDYRFKDFVLLLLKGRRKRWFYNHIAASEVRERVGQPLWNSYYKFCVERNPWDRVVSLYYWQNKTEPRQPFSTFIQSDAPLSLKRKGFELYTIDGRVTVDKICRFENLSEELEVVRTRLGIPEELNLPHAKSRFRKDKENYRDIYGE